MIKQKKNSLSNLITLSILNAFSILILTTDTDGLYHNYFLMADLNMLIIYQSLCDSFSDFGYTLIVDADYLEYLQPLPEAATTGVL